MTQSPQPCCGQNAKCRIYIYRAVFQQCSLPQYLFRVVYNRHKVQSSRLVIRAEFYEPSVPRRGGAMAITMMASWHGNAPRISSPLVVRCPSHHYSDVIMGSIACQITSLTIVYSIVYSGEDQRKHQSSASLTFLRGIHRGPVNSPHKGPVTRKMCLFDDVIMIKQWSPHSIT